MKRTRILLILVAALLIFTTTGLAMDSTHYRLDWYPPLTGPGGLSTSTHYTAEFTLGQSATGSSTSLNYQLGLGYWAGRPWVYRMLLPMALR